MSTTIYIVSDYTNYEGGSPIRAFASKADAEALVTAFDEHQDKRPDYPDSDAPDDAYEKYERAVKRWEKKHPAPDSSYCHGLVIAEMQLEEPSP